MADAGEFELYQPTQVVCRPGLAASTGQYARVFGARALLVCGERSARDSGALQRVVQSLDAAGIEYDLIEGIPANPDAATVDAGGALARSQGTEVVIALGGGSVLDAAKAIAVAAVHQVPYRSFLSGIRSDEIAGSLPLVAVPTLPGSGSETNGTSVIVDTVSGRKLSAHSELAAPRVALLDVEVVRGAPHDLLAYGLADALCHALEARLSAAANIASDSLADAAAALLLREGMAAVDGEPAALTRAMWASNLAGQALALAGSVVTHPLAHPLSAHGAHHGATVAALEPVVLERLGERWGDGLLAVGRWFGTRARTREGALRTITAKFDAWLAAIGAHSTLAGLGVTPAMTESFVDDVLASGSRGLANTPGPELQRDDLRALYDAALAVAPSPALAT